jgi:hypothetical protein
MEELRIPLDQQPRRPEVRDLPMAAQHATISWDSFKWVVSGLLGVLAVLIGGLFAIFRSDLSDVRLKLDDIRTEMHQNHVDIVRSVSAIGAKLDQMSQDIHRR